MKEFDYNDVIELGFKRQDMNDNIFFNKCGYQWFIVTLKLAKHIYLDWDCNTRTIQMIRVEKGFIKHRMDIVDMNQLTDILRIFGKLEYEETANFA